MQSLWFIGCGYLPITAFTVLQADTNMFNGTELIAKMPK